MLTRTHHWLIHYASLIHAHLIHCLLKARLFCQLCLLHGNKNVRVRAPCAAHLIPPNLMNLMGAWGGVVVKALRY